MWALNKRLISNADGLAKLERWKSLWDLQSNVWLLPAHCPLLGVKANRDKTHLLISTDELINESPKAFPFAQIPERLRRELYLPRQPTCLSKEKYMILDWKSKSDNVDVDNEKHRENQTKFGLLWRHATEDELFDALLYVKDNNLLVQQLLCSTSIVLPELEIPGTIELLNAQETNNPFLIDETLQHTDILTNKPLPAAVSSSLITVAAQFHYTSLRWIEVSKLGLCSPALKAVSEPHTITELEELELVHVSQLSEECQHYLASHIPRYVLLKSVTNSFVLRGKRWFTWRSLNISQSSNKAHIATNIKTKSHLKPLLWVDINSERGNFCDNVNWEFKGKSLKRTRHSRKKYYNATQLVRDDDFKIKDDIYVLSDETLTSMPNKSSHELATELEVF